VVAELCTFGVSVMASTVTQFPPATYSSSYFFRNVIKEVRGIVQVYCFVVTFLLLYVIIAL